MARLVLFCVVAIVRASDDFDNILKIYDDVSHISKRYINESLDVRPGFLKSLTLPLHFKWKTPNEDAYDFIIIGGGSAGSVVASRLSEVRHWTVLLLEAGKAESVLSQVPMFVPALYYTQYNWREFMEYDPHYGRGMEDQRVPYAHGKGLGGTSVINYMIYSRGQPQDYDLWGSLGNPGWFYEDVLPYFKKSERANFRSVDRNFHGTDGYLSVEETHQTQLMHAFVRAGGEIGYETYIDYNGRDEFGFAPILGTLLDGRRHTTARAFLFHALDRPNLNVLTEAFVTKVLIEGPTKRAYGVEYVRNSKTQVAYARKEVILSAGQLHSPQLLMLSGIGPRRHLEEMGIPVLSNLPVGEEYYDHIVHFGVNFRPKHDMALSLKKLLDPILVQNYVETGEGPLSSIGGVAAIAFIKTNRSSTRPDVELVLNTATIGLDYGAVIRRTFGVRQDVFDAHWGPLNGKPSFTISFTKLHPKSKGHIKLRSQSPFVPPLMYGNYLSDPDGEDVRTMIAAVRFLQEMTLTDTFKKYGIVIDESPIPGCEMEYDTDEYWECAIRSLSGSFWHQVAADKMGPPDDPSSVVDHALRVYGIKGLRVADSSVIPIPVGCHTNAPAVMIGEKASDMIKETWADHAEG